MTFYDDRQAFICNGCAKIRVTAYDITRLQDHRGIFTGVFCPSCRAKIAAMTEDEVAVMRVTQTLLSSPSSP